MNDGSPWDWPANAFVSRRQNWTVGQRIHWSYGWLVATRMKMANPDLEMRNRVANKWYGLLTRGERHISSFEREWMQNRASVPCCAHCGRTGRLTRDHLIPRSRGGDGFADNLVSCCPPCNSARGNADLMRWYRSRQRFPTLVVMRQYLKLCDHFARELRLFETSVDEAVARGLPFDPIALPEKFPDMADIRYDWRMPLMA